MVHVAHNHNSQYGENKTNILRRRRRHRSRHHLHSDTCCLNTEVVVKGVAKAPGMEAMVQ